MKFLWPHQLWLLLSLPLLVLLYAWLMGRKKKLALRYASLSVVKEAMGKGPGWRRHVPPALLLLAISAGLLAASRPMAVITLPLTERTTMETRPGYRDYIRRTSTFVPWVPKKDET